MGWVNHFPDSREPWVQLLLLTSYSNHLLVQPSKHFLFKSNTILSIFQLIGNSNELKINLSVWLCVCVSLCAWMGMHVWEKDVEVRGQPPELVPAFHFLWDRVWDRVSSFCQCVWRASWPGSLGIFLLPPISLKKCWDYRCTQPFLTLRGSWRWVISPLSCLPKSWDLFFNGRLHSKKTGFQGFGNVNYQAMWSLHVKWWTPARTE